MALNRLQFGEGFQARRWQEEEVLCLQVLERKWACETANLHDTLLRKPPYLIPTFSTIYKTPIRGSVLFPTFDFEVITFNM